MIRDLSSEPELATDDIQGDILPGLLKRHEDLIFFAVDDVAAFSAFVADLPVTTMQEVLDQRALAESRKVAGIGGLVPAPGLNLAFSYAGLQLLGVDGLDTAEGLEAFQAGMAARTDLADPDPTGWSALTPGVVVHGVFVITGATPAEIDNVIALRLSPAAAHGWHVVHEELGQVRPEPVHGHEHFGYADGISQPGVRGILGDGTPLTVSVDPTGRPAQGMLGQDLLWPGEFVFGYPTQVPFVDPEGDDDFTVEGPVAEPPVPFMQHGAFMVFRRLAQLVPEFNQAVAAAAASIDPDVEDEADADLLGAQLVGRWKSGAPLVKAPTADDPAFAEGTGLENDFEFGGDRSGTDCPWAAHIRKAYPRDDVRGDVSPSEEDGEVKAAEAFTQTHRMMRRGITFGPELTHGEALAGVSSAAHERGLLFKCYVTSIEDQFEFVQKQWINADDFVQPACGVDALIGQPDAPQPFLGAAPISGDPDRKPQFTFGRFVHMQGGEYFFAPSVSALHDLTKAQPSA